MKVFKFGGASVATAEAIRNVGKIISKEVTGSSIASSISSPTGSKINAAPTALIVVVSAIGSTTDSLVEIVRRKKVGDDALPMLYSLRLMHQRIINALFGEHDFKKSDSITAAIDKIFQEIELKLLQPEDDYELFFDDIVSYGELISSRILSHYLSTIKIKSVWRDARDIIVTDDEFGAANVIWCAMEVRILEQKSRWSVRNECDVIVTQGFIGATPAGTTTTLGREGSDFSAAILASAFEAESVTLWKDVPGLMNADPKLVPSAEVLEEIHYEEAADMMYHGANLIHVKTIQPLAEKNIPLLVKSFIDPSLPGTRIHNSLIKITRPMIVFKKNQVLVLLRHPGIVFLTERDIQEIFMILSNHAIKPRLIEHSPRSLRLGFDFDHDAFLPVLKRFSESYEVYYKVGLTLVTLKNVDEAFLQPYRENGKVLAEQTSQGVLQLMLRDVPAEVIKSQEAEVVAK